MSRTRIIKASAWDEAPCVIEVPEPPPPPSPEGEEGEAAVYSVEDAEREAQEMLEAAEARCLEMEAAYIGKRARLDEDIAAFEATREAMMADLFKKKKEAEEFLEHTRAECSSMKTAAEEEHNNIIEDAQQQAESIREDARKAGHDEGFAAGHEEGLAKAAEEQQEAILAANAKAEKTMADAKEESAAYVRQAEDEIAQLALQVVEKILPQHFIDVPQIILPLIRKALLKVKDQPEVIVRVAPADYDLALLARSEFQNLLEGNAELTVHSDENLKQGDVVLETPNGNVDARVATQLEAVRKAMQDVMS